MGFKARLTKDISVYPSLTFKSGRVVTLDSDELGRVWIYGYKHVQLSDCDWVPVWDNYTLDKILNERS